MKTQENNKMIAEFMGLAPNECGVYQTKRGPYHLENLSYHIEWHWLMPVVDKIECTTIDNNDNSDNFFSVMIEVFECNINGGDICICKSGHTKRDATYNAVVEFINQYNKNK